MDTQVSMTGVVEWFNTAKGYGFIKGQDGVDIFVHYSNIVAKGFKGLHEDDVVEYSVENLERNGKQAKQAINVKVITSNASKDKKHSSNKNHSA